MSPRSRNETILVIDDEPLVRILLVDLFEEQGFPVEEAANAAEALDVLKSHGNIRIVITDIQMPGSMDGLRLAKFIHDAYPPIALIVASGGVQPDRASLPDDAIFMAKPIDVQELLKRVDTLTRAR